ncbi:MAG TPA: ribbon-helix-helix domain-containing protein [Terriglobia bacterium]|nr:ribbon-helix-helix domain-containing protein [Terriglobia bacterium]
MTKNKKASVNFLAGFRSMEERDAIKRHPPAKPAKTPAASNSELPPSLQVPQQPSRRGKVAITHWVDPAVRKQLARMSIDHDSSQAALVAEALNLLFEKYGQPPIAAPLQEDSSVLQPTA